MSLQLVLIDDSERSWRLDDETRDIGRKGIEAARQALRAAPRRPEPESEPAPSRHAA